MIKQVTKIAMMLVLAIGFMASEATARNINGDGFVGVGLYTGVETAQGTCEPIFGMCYGNSFALNIFGEWETHHLTVSLNYLNTQNHNGSGFEVSGGSWSLVVYQANVYVGTLYGKVLDGSIRLAANNNGEIISKQTQLNLMSTGGSGIFKIEKDKEITGIYNAITQLPSGETTGGVNFNF